MPLVNDKQFQMRVSDEFLAKLDAWRRAQPDLPGRAEAVRRLAEAGLAKLRAKAPKPGVSVDGMLPNETDDPAEADQFHEDQRKGR
jgi:hypothetical protein